MDGSPSSVLSVGFGSWGSTGLVLTLGLGIGAAAVVTPPDYFYPLRCIDSLRTSLTSAESLRVDLLSNESLRVDLRTAQ